MRYKEPATWRDTRDQAIDLEPLTPAHAAACAEYRELRERQLQRKLTEVRTHATVNESTEV